MNNIITIDSKKENNAQLHLDILIITEVLLHGTKKVIIDGIENTLVSHVVEFVKNEGISFTDPLFGSILEYVQELPSDQVDFPILTLLGSKNNDIRLAVEEYLRLYYMSLERSIPLFGQKKLFDGTVSHDFSIEKIKHLFYDYRMFEINTRIKDIKSKLKDCYDMDKIKTLMVEFRNLQNKRNELCNMLGIDLIL